MTRADPIGEPSMEDILASIRKIIAEEPPGSRPVVEARPAPAPAVATQPFRPFARTPEPEPQAPLAPEPYLRPQPRNEAVQAFPAASVPESAAASPASPESLERREPAFAPVPAATSAPVRPAPSVDDQLSDLLGAAASQPLKAPPVSAAPDFITRMTTRQQQQAAEAVSAAEAAAALVQEPVAPEAPVSARPEIRPGFTVSRAGYVPEASPVAPPKRDMFEFDLGPSPFDNRQQQTEPGLREPALPPRDEIAAGEPVLAPAIKVSAADLGSFVPVRHTDAAPTAAARPPAPAEVQVQIESAVTTSRIAADPIVAEPPKAAEPQPAPQAALPVTQPPPTLETLLPPAAPVAAPAAAKVEHPARTPAEVQATDNVDAEASEVAIFEPVHAPVHEPVQEAFQEPNGARVAAASSPVISEHAMTLETRVGERSMEETVAELLRPMLRSWLAENMPNIVERALRRELAEINLIEHKPAAE
jgi:cell pole-organizing protein PopZ